MSYGSYCRCRYYFRDSGFKVSYTIQETGTQMKTTFYVDYYLEEGGRKSRQQMQGSSTLNLAGSTSDFAVQNYLQERHQGKTVSIMNIKWS